MSRKMIVWAGIRHTGVFTILNTSKYFYIEQLLQVGFHILEEICWCVLFSWAMGNGESFPSLQHKLTTRVFQVQGLLGGLYTARWGFGVTCINKLVLQSVSI